MVLKERNVAYDLSVFEEVKVDRDNVLELPHKKTNVKGKRSAKSVIVFMLSVAFSVSLAFVGMVVYNQVQLTELTANINTVSKQLNESEGVYTQLKVKADSSLSLSIVEDYAKNELDMKKIDPNQIEYISLSNGDKAIVKEEGSLWKF